MLPRLPPLALRGSPSLRRSGSIAVANHATRYDSFRCHDVLVLNTWMTGESGPPGAGFLVALRALTRHLPCMPASTTAGSTRVTRSGKRQSARIVPTGSLAFILRPPVSISPAAFVTSLLAAGDRSAPVPA